MMQIGEKINRLTLVEYAGIDKYGRRMGIFKCDCGVTKKIAITLVKTGRTKTCGCSRKSIVTKRTVKIGEKINKLTLIAYVDRHNHSLYGLFKCDCGNEVKVRCSSVKTGRTMSCGCYNKLAASRRMRVQNEKRGTRMMVGEKINRLTLIKYTGFDNRLQRKGVFKCDCGTIKECVVSRVFHGKLQSCGCLHDETISLNGKKNLHDLTGLKIGRLTVLKKGEPNKYGVRWICQCECGKIHVVQSGSLLNGSSLSCGCLQKELAMERQILRLTNGISWGSGRKGWFVSKKQNINIHYDSSYEEKALSIWESDSTISSFNRSKDRITYVNPVDGSSHVYLPDFIVNDTRMIEIKPQYQFDDPVVQAKAAAAEAYCSERGMTYEIWTEHELGLIK